MPQVFRNDFMSLAAPQEMPDGRLVVDAYLTRTGVFSYRDAQGNVTREYRPPEDCMSARAIDTLRQVVLTDDHPPQMVNPTNARKFARGVVGETVHRDGDRVRGKLLVFDADLIGKMKGGKKQISCGYFADLEFTPGRTPAGEEYDAIQRNHVYNHVAVVDVGRAGPDVAVRMDGAASMVEPGDDQDAPPSARTDSPEVPAMSQVTRKALINAITFDVAEQVAQALDAERAAFQAKVDAATGERDAAVKARETLQAKLDEAVGQRDKLQARLDDALDPAKRAAEIRARASLLAVATAVLGAEAVKERKLDEATERAVMVEVVKARRDGFDDKGKSDDYVRARFDAVVEDEGGEGGAAAEGRLDASRRAAAPVVQPGTGGRRDTEDDARARMIKHHQDAANTPHPEGTRRATQ